MGYHEGRRRRPCAEEQLGEEGGPVVRARQRRERRRTRHHCGAAFCFFISLEMFLYGPTLPPPRAVVPGPASQRARGGRVRSSRRLRPRPVSVRCSVLLPARLPHRPALAREHAPPPSRSLLLPLVCCRPLLNFSNTRISRPSTPASCDICLSRDFPDRLRCEPCEVMHSVWTAFCSRNSVSGVVAFTALPVTTMHLSWCDPSRLL